MVIVMDMQNTDNSNSSAGRPLLRKVKRPINKMQPMSSASAPSQPSQGFERSETPSFNTQEQYVEQPASAPSSKPMMPTNNPFVQQMTSQSDSAPTFDVNSFLDEEINLPANYSNTKTSSQEQLRFINEEEYEKEISGDTQSPLPEFLNKKVLVLMGVVLFFLGFVTSKVFFSEAKVVRNGLQGVVINPEVPKGRPRCGVAEKMQGCVLYMMNPQRQELNARDFYDLASQLTGRQRFIIETGNMRYSNTKIRPGDIVQLNIPPL